MTAQALAPAGIPDQRSAAERLRALHHGEHPLVLPNAWDAVSARAFAGAGFEAVATSSAAIAATLGCHDGQTPAATMLDVVARIAASVPVPVTADIEDGYGIEPDELVARLKAAGIAGCNLEDSVRGTRTLIETQRHADFLAAVGAAAGDDLVINARIDVFLHRGRSDEAAATKAALQRAEVYLAAGVDCVYPILAPASALPELVRAVDGPVNAMCWPGGPSIAEMADLGVARISFGSVLHAQAAEGIRSLAAALAADSAGQRDAALPPRGHDQRTGSESIP
jgi:2-methylisocitrate lyase-like PEP mutase family enzyme